MSIEIVIVKHSTVVIHDLLAVQYCGIIAWSVFKKGGIYSHFNAMLNLQNKSSLRKKRTIIHVVAARLNTVHLQQYNKVELMGVTESEIK